MYNMILNEVENGIYRIRIGYLSTAFNRKHTTQVYTSTPLDVNSEGAFIFAGINDPFETVPQPFKLSKLIRNIFNRAGDGYSAIGEKLIENVEVSLAVAGENQFLGVDEGDYTQPVASGVAIASAHLVWVFTARNKRQFRMSFFDAAVSSPQRVPRLQPPTVDDGSMGWLFTKSPVTFTTRYGEPLTRVSTLNTGYNRKLANSYGRTQ
jgi:hypothetical protein